MRQLPAIRVLDCGLVARLARRQRRLRWQAVAEWCVGIVVAVGVGWWVAATVAAVMQ